MKKSSFFLVFIFIVGIAGYYYFSHYRALIPIVFKCENIIKETMKNKQSYKLISFAMSDSFDKPKISIEFYGTNSYGAQIKSTALFLFKPKNLCDSSDYPPDYAKIVAEGRVGKTIFESSNIYSVTIGNTTLSKDDIFDMEIFTMSKKQTIPYAGKGFPRKYKTSELIISDKGICTHKYTMAPTNSALVTYDSTKLFPYEK